MTATAPTITPAKLRSALRRPVRHIPPTRYIVGQDPDDPDPRLNYLVRWDPITREHHCACYGTETQAEAEGCSHVAAAVHHQRRAWARADLALRRQLEAEAVDVLAADPLPLPTDPALNPPGAPPFPDWVVGFRRHQWDGVERVAQCFDEGAKVVMFQAPVGSGKTLAAESVRRLLNVRGVYVATTKTLQDQAARDFPYARVLKGRANYPTLSGGVELDGWGRAKASDPSSRSSKVTAADCTSTAGGPCRWCSPVAACPYRNARVNAERADLAVLNTSYFLTDANKGGRRFARRGLAIFDEADLLEGELLNQAEVVISQRRMRNLHMAPPPRKTVESTWGPWVLEEALPRVRERLAQIPPAEHCSLVQLRERKGLAQLHERLEDLAVQLPEGGWVYDGYKRGDVVFRPIEVSAWGRLLWPHAERFLLMSGSIISADEMASSLGLEGDYRLVDVPMTFPVENRPVNVVALAEVTAKNQEQAWPRVAQGLAGVLALHPDERVLVHTVSYNFATHLMEAMRKAHPGRPLVTYSNRQGERDEALARYKATPGAVLLAPSMDRGIDLPGDLCRVVVIAKIPYPNLGDKRTSARLYGTPTGQAWYAVNTVRTLIQMTGRGVRGADDQATAYILDHTFTTNVWRKSRNLLPGWWCEAVNFRFPVHRLLRAQRSA